MFLYGNEAVFGIGGNTATWLIYRSGFTGAIEHSQELCANKRVMIYAGYCSGRLVERYILIVWRAAELLGKKRDMGHTEAVLNCDCRAWLINRRRYILSTLAHAVELDQKCVFTTGDKPYQSGIDTFERIFCQWSFPCENGFTYLFKIEDVAYWSPPLQIAGGPSAVGWLREYNWQAFLGKHSEIPLACGPGTIVGRVYRR